MRIFGGFLSICFSLWYLWTNISLLKPFPAFSLFLLSKNYKISLILTGIGDLLLDYGYLAPSLIFFGGCHFFLLPKKKLIIPWYLIILGSQLGWLYPYLSYEVFIIVPYSWMISLLLWNVMWERSLMSLAIILYTVADVVVLLNLVLEELNIRYLSLGLYWTSLWLIALSTNDAALSTQTIDPEDRQIIRDYNNQGQHSVDKLER